MTGRKLHINKFIGAIMESRIPLPTDNIYKFYALFGLLLFIFGFSAVIYTTKSTNEFMVTALVDLEDLKSKTVPTVREATTKKLLERQIEVAKLDKEVFSNWSIGITALGTLLMFLGFYNWHSVIQPKLDELSELQLLKLRYEVEQQKGQHRRRVLKRI